MTEPKSGYTHVVRGGSIVIMPLTVAQDCDITVDETSILIIWDDDADDIASVREEMRQALEIMRGRLASVEASQYPKFLVRDDTGEFVEATPDGAPPPPTRAGPVYPPGSEPRDET